jgi:hypothetical protein
MSRLINIPSRMIGTSVGLTAKILVRILGGIRPRTNTSTVTLPLSGRLRSRFVMTKLLTSLPNTPISEQDISRLKDQENEGLRYFFGSTKPTQIPLLHWPEDKE